MKRSSDTKKFGPVLWATQTDEVTMGIFMTKIHKFSMASAALSLCLAAGGVQASLITEGFTFSVASDCNDTSVGHHYHSNTGGAFGNPDGKAEVGGFGCEEVRGLSEYDLTGLGASAEAFVSFEVFDDGGLFPGTNDYPFDGTIQIDAYQGNNQEDVSDYQAESIGIVATFATSGLFVGNTLSFDITAIFNALIDVDETSLGIRLAAVPVPANQGAWTFDNFRLTSDDLTTPTGVPEPGTLALLGFGLAGVGFARRRKR